MTYIGSGVFIAWLVAIFVVAALVVVGCVIAIVRDGRQHTAPHTPAEPAEAAGDRVAVGV